MEHDSRFLWALQKVIEHESGGRDTDKPGVIPYDPADPGGATNYWGVSLRYLSKIGAVDRDGDGWLDGDYDKDGDIDADDIAAMTYDQAATLYYEQWWARYGYGDLVLGVGAKVFDLAVNMGAGQAHKLLQRAVWAAAGEADHISDDGILGPKTREAISRYANKTHIIIAPLRSEAAGFYRGLIVKNSDFRKYETGWLRRAYD